MRYRRGLIIHFEDREEQAHGLANTLSRIPLFLERRATFFDGTEDPALIPSLEEFCREFGLNNQRRVQKIFSAAKIDRTDVQGYQEAEREVHGLVQQIDASPDLPVYVNVVSGIVGRRLIHELLPGAIISDTSFPLNGQATVQWMNSHGLGQFPVIGLSATPFKDLDDSVQAFYTEQAGKVYLDKAKVGPGIATKLTPALLFAMHYVDMHHDTFLKSYSGGKEFRELI